MPDLGGSRTTSFPVSFETLPPLEGVDGVRKYSLDVVVAETVVEGAGMRVVNCRLDGSARAGRFWTWKAT